MVSMMETKKKTDLSDEVKLDNHTMEQPSFQLSQSSAFLKNFPDSVAVLATNENGFITTFNKTAEHLFGYSKEELLSRHISLFMEEPPEDLELIAQAGSEAGWEINCKKKNGSVFPVRLRLTCFKSKKDESLSRIFIFEDMKYGKGMDRALVEPLQFEMLLSELFAAFVNIQDSEFDDKINYALRRIAQVLKIDRCLLLQYRYNTKHFVTTHSWVAEGIPNGNIIGFGSAATPWIYTNYALHLKIFQCNRLDDLPDEAEADKRFFLKFEMKSILIIPIIENQLPVGAFVLGQVRFERTWTPEFVKPLKRVAEVLLNVLLKKRSEEKLQRAFQEIKQLKDQLESERNYLQEEIRLEHNFENIIGQSQSLQYALLKVGQVAPTDTTALILGETGTGKELLARAVHDKSRRKKRRLIKVN